MNPLLSIAVKVALSAGKTITRYYEQLPDNSVQRKSGHDFVTTIDQMVENDIIQQLRKSYPDHGFLAEESGFQPGNENDNIWIIDPLDGTNNYIHGMPHFCVSIALQFKGRITQGVIYDPIRQDLFTASRGRGAQLNDRRIRVATRAYLEDTLVACPFPHLEEEKLPIVKQLYQQVSGMRHGGAAALDLAYVAAGRLDAFWEEDLRVWDVAAGGLLIEEAGGFISDWQGNPNYMEQEKCDVLAANPKLFKQLLPLVQRGYSQKIKPQALD